MNKKGGFGGWQVFWVLTVMFILVNVLGSCVKQRPIERQMIDDTDIDDHSTKYDDCSANHFNCADFRTQREAQAMFLKCGGVARDVHHLDGDQDGRACETLP